MSKRREVYFEGARVESSQDDEFFADDDSHARDPSPDTSVGGVRCFQCARNPGRWSPDFSGECESCSVEQRSLLRGRSDCVCGWTDAYPKLMPESKVSIDSNALSAARGVTELRLPSRTILSSASKTYDLTAHADDEKSILSLPLTLRRFPWSSLAQMNSFSLLLQRGQSCVSTITIIPLLKPRQTMREQPGCGRER